MFEMTLQLIIFLFPLAYSPGPGNILMAATGAQFGFSATLPFNLGYHLATFIVTLLLGLGSGALLLEMPYILTTIRFLGSGFILYLAWRLYQASAVEAKVVAKPAGFVEGAIFLAVNPKAYVIIMLLFSQFPVTENENFIMKIVFLTVVFTANNFLCFTFWALVGKNLMTLIKSTHGHMVNRVFGVILGAFGVWMLVA